MREKVSKSLLKLSNSEAREFLLQGKSFCTLELPKYFVFDQLINETSNKLLGSKLTDFCIPKKKPNEHERVNYKILGNKDGKYAWRPLQLIHPALYVSLVHTITEEENWGIIHKRIDCFRVNKKIECMSIPVQSYTDESDKAALVNNWWNHIEQNSIKQALDFQYILTTDIADCYGSIYTHSIAWALHGRKKIKGNLISKSKEKLIGNEIDKQIQNMSFGQTNGIPQGSVLMDFIAEIVLGYVDLRISRIISENEVSEYKIIRYRDDYRVFVNNPKVGEFIVKTLSEVLLGIGMRLNPQKTKVSSEVIQDSLKADKYHWISNERTGENLQRHLLIIHSLSQKFPNSGSLERALKSLKDRIKATQELKDDPIVLVSILTDIALKSPRIYPTYSAILARIIDFVDDNCEKIKILKMVSNRFQMTPNTGFLDIWLQRITYSLDKDIHYSGELCKLVKHEEDVDLWNSCWLKEELQKIINPLKIIDMDKLKKMSHIIEDDEVDLFYRPPSEL